MKKILLVLLMLLTMGISSFAQNLADYVMTTGTDASRWETLSNPTTILELGTATSGDGRASAVTNIGFTFNFAGTDYTQFSVNSDGNLRFGSTVTGTSYYSTPFSSSYANQNNPKINMLGCDGYITDSGYVHQEVIGTAPDRVCVIEFATSTYNTTSRPSLLRWQVQLFETSNEIQIVYPSTMPPILPNVARQPGMCVNNTNIILIDASHGAAFYNAGSSTNQVPTGTWPDVDRYYHFAISSCHSPSGLTVSNITINGADLSWTAPTGATDFILEYKPVSGTWEDDAIVENVTGTTYTLTGLDPNTYYNVRVANDCGGEQSNYIGTTLHTECTAISVSGEPYFEGFEGYATNSFPDCWTRISGYTSGTTNYPYITNSTTAHSGGGYFLATTNASNRIIMALPQFVEDVNTLRLSFWMKPVGATNYYGRVEVGVMTDLTDTSTFTLVNSWTAVGIGSTTWTKYEVDFDNITPTSNDYIVIRRIVTEGTTTYGWYFDDVKVMPIPLCNAPTQLSFANAAPYSVDLFWNPGEESNFTVYYRTVNETEFTAATNATLDADSIYTLSNLTPGTNYIWYVSSVCSDGSETASDPSTFATTLVPVELPYTTDFSEEADQNWMLNNGTCTNYWTMGSIGDTATALFITTNGTTPGYTITTTSIVTASKLFTVGEDAQFQISFDVNVGGETGADYIKLFLAPPTLTYPAATSAPTWAGNSYAQYAFDFTDYLSASTSTSTVVYKFNLTNGNTVHIDAIMPNPNQNPDANSTAQVVFVWKNDGSVGTQPGAIISNVSVAPVVCQQPENLTATNITAYTADISWDENDAIASFTVEYGPHGFTPGEGTTFTITGTNETTLTDLIPVTQYDIYVKSICSDGSESVNSFIMFQTACVGIDALPITWDFDNNLTAGTSTYPLPACWDRIVTAPTTQYPYAYNSSSYAHSGTRSLYFYNYYPNAIGILPGIDADAFDIQDLQLSFYARFGSSSTSYIRLDVGVMTDPTVDSTFTLVQSVPLTTSYQSDPFVVSFSNYTGNGTYIAFRNTSLSTSTSTTYIYIDDVTLEEAPSCSKALYLASTPNAFSADLTWMAQGEDFDVYYKTAADDDYTVVTDVTLVEGVFTLTGLSASTTYTWYVVTNCDDTVYTSGTATFTTSCAPEMAPFIEDFNAGTTLPNCWGRYTGLASDVFAGGALTSTTSGWLFTNINVFGEYHPKVNIYGTGCKYWLVTPEIDLSELTEPALTFNLALTKYNTALPIADSTAQLDDKFMVIISTDNGNTWSASNATVWSNDSTGDYVYNHISYTGEEVTISLEDYAGQIIRIAFYGESTVTGGDNDLHIDNVVVSEAPSCSAPSQVIVSEIDQTSAVVTWTETGTASSWILEYDTAGFELGTGITIAITDGVPTATLTDLEPFTSYEVYIQAVCPDGGNSNPATSSFTTACLALDQIPYTWNFDSIGTGSTVHPDCWICDNNYNSTRYPYVNSTTPYSGNAELYFYSSSSTYSYAVLPMVDVNTYPMNTLQISFYMRCYTPGSVRMVVGFMTDPGDMGTFEAFDTVYNSISNEYEFREVLFSDYEGTAPYVALKMINLSSTTYAYVDDVTLGFIPSCLRPTNLTVTDNSLNSVTLSWDENNASSWEISYGPIGFDPDSDTATVVSASATPFEVSNLDMASTYQFYVRAICSGSDNSPWSLPVIASTDCDVTALPYSENFDSYITSSTYSDANGIAPNCWTTWSNNATYGAPHITSTGTYHYAHSGTNSMVFTCGSSGSDAYAALPTFTDDLNTLHLNFWRAMESTSSGTLTVGYVTNINDMANSFVTVATIPSVGSSAGDTISVDFTGASIPVSGNICFHWNYSSSFYSCCIDDIEVTSNGSAPVVTDPTVATNAASAITQTAATLNATITNPDGVAITAKGFEWKLTSGGTYIQIAGTGTGNSFTANLTGLTANTGYTFKAFITYNGTTVYGSEQTFTTAAPVADPTVTTNQASAIAQTTATLNASINNPSGVTITAKGFEWKLTNGGSFTQIVGTGTGNTFTANLTGLTANTGYTFKAFITFNGNTVYGEEMTFTTLEEGQETCDVPTNLNAIATAYNTANVTWTAGGSETAWNLRYKSGTSSWTTVTATTTSYQLTGLTAQTTYEVQVQAVCNSTSSSEWTASVSFTTLAEPCEDTPINLQVNNITTTTATIGWTAVGSATEWKVQYRQQGTTQWQEATVQTTSYDMEGLTPNTTYEVQVKAVCASGSESDYVSTSFTTQTVGIDNIILAQSISLMPNPADNYIELTVNSNVNVKEAVVFNAFGQMIQKVELNDNHARIDLSDMAAGMYFVRVNSDNVSATKKFIKR